MATQPGMLGEVYGWSVAERLEVIRTAEQADNVEHLAGWAKSPRFVARLRETFPPSDAMHGAEVYGTVEETHEAGHEAAIREPVNRWGNKPNREAASLTDPASIHGTEAGFAERIIERMALRQVMDALDPEHAKALLLLADHRTQGEAAEAGGYSGASFNRLIKAARAAASALWWDGEQPHESAGYHTVKNRTERSKRQRSRKIGGATDWGDRAMLRDAYGWHGPSSREQVYRDVRLVEPNEAEAFAQVDALPEES